MSMTYFRTLRIALAAAALLALSACGNKGPLVMPQKPVPVQAQPVPQPGSGQTPAPTQTPAEAAQPTDGTRPPPTDGGQ